MSPNEGTHTFSKARVMPKVFTDLRAGETMNAESDLLSFSSITASPVHPLSVDCAGELKVGGANAFYTPGGRLTILYNIQEQKQKNSHSILLLLNQRPWN